MKDTITFFVKQADCIDPFTFEGKRNIHYHFFVKTESGWDFRWVDETTSSQWLKEKIAEGIIYIFDDEK